MKTKIKTKNTFLKPCQYQKEYFNKVLIISKNKIILFNHFFILMEGNCRDIYNYMLNVLVT